MLIDTLSDILIDVFFNASSSCISFQIAESTASQWRRLISPRRESTDVSERFTAIDEIEPSPRISHSNDDNASSSSSSIP